MLWIEKTFTENLAFIHNKMAIIAWAVLYMCFPPQIIVDKIGYWLVLLSSLIAIVGCIIGILGLFVSDSKDLVWKYRGYTFEYGGLILSLLGPLSFFVTCLYISAVLREHQLHVITAIAYALCAATVSRIVVVRRSLGKRMVEL